MDGLWPRQRVMPLTQPAMVPIASFELLLMTADQHGSSDSFLQLDGYSEPGCDRAR
jgi:hypothetical protein